jgi:hypothetical protein
MPMGVVGLIRRIARRLAHRAAARDPH